MNLPPLPPFPHSHRVIPMSDAEILHYAEQYGRLCAEAERDRLQARVSELEVDAERLDWFEQKTHEGHCPALVFDDDGRFAVSCEGMSPVPEEGGFKEEVGITVLVEPSMWKDSARAAIDTARKAKP